MARDGRSPGRIRGDYGENAAAEYLKRHGDKILARNWRCRYGELDIIALDRDIICFVEVKTRRVNFYSGLDTIGTRPGDAVGYRKREKLRLSAALWLDARRGEYPGQDPPARFDIAEIYIFPDDSAKIKYIKNAFE